MYTLPSLPFDYSALEPHIDAKTMETHHGKHHQAYIDNLNKALSEGGIAGTKSIFELITDLNQIPENIRTVVRNNGGGHANHTFFWETLAPGSQQEPSGPLAKAIGASFSIEANQQVLFNFKAQFAKAAMARFGSGWVWLGVKQDKTLCICSTPNQDSPWMAGYVDAICTPILGLDVWEHAYYLHYQNRRSDYVHAFWNVINWQKVEERYLKAIG